jgi:hypothetical protein
MAATPWDPSVGDYCHNPRKLSRGRQSPPRRPGLELSWGVTTAQREPRWNAERRAAPSLGRAAPEARMSGNIHPRGADQDLASLGVPFPHFICCSPGERSESRDRRWRSDGSNKPARRNRAAGTRSFVLHRESGGGEPRKAWWRGRLTQRFTFVERDSLKPAPLPPPCCAGWSPSPTVVGEDEQRAP